MKLALTVATYAYVLENGRLVMHGTSEKLRENPDIRDFYLGLSDIGERKSFRQVKHYKTKKKMDHLNQHCKMQNAITWAMNASEHWSSLIALTHFDHFALTLICTERRFMMRQIFWLMLI